MINASPSSSSGRRACQSEVKLKVQSATDSAKDSTPDIEDSHGTIALTKFDALLSATAKSVPSTKSSPVRSVTT